MPGGRPTVYKPEFCDKAREILADGYSVLGFAGKIGVSKMTVYRWIDQYPEFRDAVKDGQAAAASWWEDRLRDIAYGKDGNATAAIFGLKNRGADVWCDKVAQEVSGPEGGPIKTETTLDVSKLSVTALEEIAALKHETDP